MATKGVNAEKCLVWAFAENGLLENLLYGYGVRLRFHRRWQPFLKKLYQLLFPFHFKKAQELIHVCIKRGGLCFSQDVGLFEATNSENYPEGCGDIIIPIPVPSRQPFEPHSKNEVALRDEYKILRIGWIGRISSDFKIYPLITTIRRSLEYCVKRGYKLKFVIIGDGDALQQLKSYVTTLDPSVCEVCIEGFIPSEKATKIMAEEVD